MDALTASLGINTDPALFSEPSSQNKAKVSLEEIFRTKNPAAIQILSDMESKYIGTLKDCYTLNPQTSDIRTRVLQTALNCIGMPRDKIDSFIEQTFGSSQFLYKFKETAHALNAAFNFIDIFPSNERDDDLIDGLLHFFWTLQSKETEHNWGVATENNSVHSMDEALIALFRQIPPDRRMTILGCGMTTCLEFSYKQDSEEICAVFEAFRDTGPECEQIFKLAWPFLTRYQKPSEVAQFLREVYALKSEREGILSSARLVIRTDHTIENRIRILHLLANMGKEERDMLVKLIPKLYSTKHDDLCGDGIADFIELMKMLPKEGWDNNDSYKIRNYTMMVPSEARRMLSSQLAALTPIHLIQVMSCCNTLCEIYRNPPLEKNPAEYVELYNLMMNIPPDKREVYTEMTLKNIKDPTLRKRVDYLKTINSPR